MFHAKRSITLALLLITIGVSGCRDTHAGLAPSRSSSSAAGSGASSATAPAQALIAPKHPPRDSSIALYNNPTYGVSFRFPRNYAVEEQLEPEYSSLVRKQQELAAEQPGSVLVVSVLIPDDAYPNTTFLEGHLQFAINPRVTQPTCRSFAAPPNSDWHGTTGKTIVQGIPFYWREQAAADAGTALTLRDYAGFANGNCYEFFLEVASTANVINDGPSSRADVLKVFRTLEKIVSSLQIRAVPAPPAPQGLPVVHSFTIAPLSHPVLDGVYRASWRIAGAPDNDVFVSVSCSHFVGVYRVSDPQSARAGFPCGIFTPVSPQGGCFDFQLENRAARDVPVTVTLFVLSLGYGSRTIFVPSLQAPISD